MPTVPLLASVADLSASVTSQAVSQLVPSGVVMAFAGATAPNGWLLCAGALISRTTYADLFAAIGTAHGSGDGSTTFALPNYAGQFLRGRANGSANDPDRASRTAAATGGATGDNVGSVQTGAFGAHQHTVVAGVASGGTISPDVFAPGAGGDTAWRLAGVGNVAPGGNVTAAQNGGNETRPRNAYVNYIIKI